MGRVFKKSMLAGCSFFFMGQLAALPEQCIEIPDRNYPCPHIIYKSLKKDNQEKELVCVCLSDFEILITPPANDKERISQKMALKQYTAILDLTEEELLELIRY